LEQARRLEELGRHHSGLIYQFPEHHLKLVLVLEQNVGARAELSAEINRFIIFSNFAIGVCGRIGVGFFSRELCNPSALRWLPVTILRRPRIDFSRFC
jgi:hypothetical protein